MKKKRIILSAGGTGGHLFPAQALAQTLIEHEILFVGGGLTHNRFFDKGCFPFKEVVSATFSLKKPFQVLKGSVAIIKGVKQSLNILRSFAPNVVVGFGSYHTLPVLLAAKRLGTPLILHEQNAHLGKVNRLFARYAHTTALTFPLPVKGNSTLVRFPLRPQPLLDPWSYFGLTKGLPTLLVFGGSQGAAKLNALFLEALHYLKGYQVLHFTGKEDPSIVKQYEALGIPHCVRTFEPHLPLSMQITDLAITRAGASTIAELTEAKTPAILIPFPHATDNHQEKNARHFSGGVVYAEEELTGEKLAKAILNFPLCAKKKEIQKSERITLKEVIEELINHE